jgi:lipopolysaccharide transport system permease protein
MATPAVRRMPVIPAASAVVVYERPSVLGMVRDAWRQRGLVLRLGTRPVAKGVAATRLGWPWLILGPSLPLLGMGLLFGGILQVPSGDVPYLPFLLAGMGTWMLFDRTLFWSTRSFEPIRRLLRNLNVPPLVVPFSGVVMGSVYFIVYMGILAVLLAYYAAVDGTLYLEVGSGLLVAIAGVALTIALAWSIGIWLSVANAWARDVRLTLRYVLQIWLYITPVIYPPSALPQALEFLATVNPAAAPVEMVKYGLLGTGEVDVTGVAVTIGFTLVVFAGGLVFFRRVWHGLLTGGFRQRRDDDEDDEL